MVVLLLCGCQMIQILHHDHSYIHSSSTCCYFRYRYLVSFDLFVVRELNYRHGTSLDNSFARLWLFVMSELDSFM